jgi:hypothetical protein
MNHDDDQSDDYDRSPGDELDQCAQQAEGALRRLAHLTLARPELTPAEVEIVLGHLAETLAAVPQVAAHLSSILDRSRDTHLLAMDALTATTDPELAIDTARLHLEELRDPAVQTYRHLNAARNQTAHISATPLDEVDDVPSTDVRDPRWRHEHRPPPAGPSRRGPAR